MKPSGLSSRLNEIDRTLDSYLQKVNVANFASPWSQSIRVSFFQIFTWLRSKVKELLKEMEKSEDYSEDTETLAGISTRLLVDELIRQTEKVFAAFDKTKDDYIFANLYDYLDSSLRESFLRIPANVAIILTNDVDTHEINFTKNTVHESESRRMIQLHIVYLPAYLYSSLSNWPIVFHEIGHLITDLLAEKMESPLLKAKLIEQSVYLEPHHREISNSAGSPEQWKHFLIELEADLIACHISGPIYLFRSYDLFTQRFLISKGRHPQWNIRYETMLKFLKKNADEAINTDFREILEEIAKTTSKINKEEKVGGITYKEFSDKSDKLIDETNNTYPSQIIDNDYQKCKEMFKEFKPKTAGGKEIVTAAYFIERLNEFSPRIPEKFSDPTKLQKEFNLFIGDCLRLTRIKRMWIEANKNSTEVSGDKS